MPGVGPKWKQQTSEQRIGGWTRRLHESDSLLLPYNYRNQLIATYAFVMRELAYTPFALVFLTKFILLLAYTERNLYAHHVFSW